MQNFAEKILNKLSNHIFIEEMFNEVAPYRKHQNLDYKESNPKKAGVLLNLFQEGDAIFFSLIQRPNYKGVHSNQISLPGGKVEKIDKNIFDTALREAHEEVNILPSDTKILGSLTQVYIPPSNFLITPVLSYSNKKPDFSPEEKEVAEIFHININELTDPTNLQKREIVLSNGYELETPCFVLNEKIVWGATCMILNEFKHLLLNPH